MQLPSPAIHRYIQPSSRGIIPWSYFVTMLEVTPPSSPHTSRKIIKVSALSFLQFHYKSDVYVLFNFFFIDHDHGKWHKNYVKFTRHYVNMTETSLAREWGRFRGNWYVFTTAMKCRGQDLGPQSRYSFVKPVSLWKESGLSDIFIGSFSWNHSNKFKLG